MNNIALISFSELPVLQTMILSISREFLQNGVNHCIILSKKIFSLETEYEKNNLLLLETPKRPTPSLSSIALFMKIKKQILAFVKQKNINKILFTSKHIWNFLLMRSLSNNNIEFYHIFHDPIGHTGQKISKGVLLYNKIISRQLTAILTMSTKSYNDTIKVLKPKCKVYKITFSDRGWLDYNFSNKQYKNILLFGRLTSYKGLEFIPKLAKKIYDLDSSIMITIAGKSSSDVSPTLLKEISTAKNVRLVNEFIPEKDIDSYYEKADFCLILHTSITQSGVILDAYRHSKTVICFDIDGIQDFLSNDFAYSIKAFDLDAMAKCIVMLENNFSLIIKNNKKAWEFGKNNFSIKKMINDIIDCLELEGENYEKNSINSTKL